MQIRKALSLIIGMLVYLPGQLPAQTENKDRPNIIFILADDLGYGDLGCYGQTKIETPNIDQLAKEGLRFTQFYSGSTVCAPARSAFLTGLHTGHTPIRGNKAYQPEGQEPLPDSVITFVNLLQQQGYATAAFGKWGLGYINTGGDPNKKGFDRFFGYNCQTLAHDYYPEHLWDNRRRIEFPGNSRDRTDYSADVIHREAIEYIREPHNKPFFLFLPYTAPHAEVIVPEDELFLHYMKKFDEKPDTSRRMYDRRPLGPYPHASFAAMVARLDQYVGDIIKTVEEKGLAENTLIIFTSDNGPHKEGGGDPDFFNSNGIYRGIKRDLYEGGIRVPFIAYWPGRIRPGISNQVAALWDMHPTILELAGISTPVKTDGISLLPTMMGKKDQRQHAYLYWEFHENDGRQAIRWNNWKGVRLNVNKELHPSLELYDLEKDPEEANDLADRHPGIVNKLNDLLDKAHHSNPDWPLLYHEFSK